MKALYIFYVSVAFVSVILILDQIWTRYFDFETFLKIITTVGLVGGLVLVIQLIRGEVVSDKKLKDDKYVD